MRHEFLFQEGSLWPLIAAPSVWAAHFLLSYWIGAVWCARYVGDDGSLLWVQVSVGALTVAALLTLGWLARKAVRGYQGRLMIDDDLVGDSEQERTRFMGHATLLLCTLSAVAVVFDAVPVAIFATCS